MSCHLCGTPLERGVVVGIEARHGELQTNIACAGCSLVQCSPLPTEEELSAYYAGPYRERFKHAPLRGADGAMHEHGSPEFERLMDEASRHYAMMIANVCKLDHTSRTLEIGCGEGRLVQQMRSIVADADGYEPDDSANCRVPTTHLLSETRTFDAVILVHVLEHFREPLAKLAEMRKRIKRGGFLWLEVPNVETPYGDLSHFFQTPHLYNFSPVTLTLLLVVAGFDEIAVQAEAGVLYARAQEQGSSPRSFAEAVSLLGRPVPTAESVADALVTYQATRDGNPGLRMGKWLGGEDTANQAWLREEFTRLSSAMGDTLSSLTEMANRLDALSGDAAEQWSADPWVYGYRCGQSQTRQVLNVACSHLANAIVWRATQ